MTDIIQNIISLEWKMFDRVQNIGGRAPCQDDRTTFCMMRSSQFNTWAQPVCESYLLDLQDAERAGRNLLQEKYAYMMERTSPSEFSRIKDQIPPRTPEKDDLIDDLCTLHVAWLEDLQLRYPRLAGRGRPIRKSTDTPYSTSFETYLWGELSTYSLRTLELYAEYVCQLWRKQKNLNELILQETVQQYGYTSLQEAETHLSAAQGKQ